MESRPIREGCEERFRTLFRWLDEGEARLDEHSKLISNHGKTIAVLDTRLVGVIEGLEKNNKIMIGLITTLIAQLVGFFVYAVKMGAFH